MKYFLIDMQLEFCFDFLFHLSEHLTLQSTQHRHKKQEIQKPDERVTTANRINIGETKKKVHLP